MPKKYYRIELTGGTEIQVFIETTSGWVINFVVKLIILFEGGHYEVVRYDTAHGCPHKDVLDIDGNVKRKVWFELLDNKQALDLAIKDLKDNHELYVGRYLKWLEK